MVRQLCGGKVDSWQIPELVHQKARNAIKEMDEDLRY